MDSSTSLKNVPYKNANLSVEERVKDLLQRMTLEEKVAQMLCIWGEKNTVLFQGKGELNEQVLRERYKDGIGQIARLSDTGGGLLPRQMAELSNRLQKFFVEETRLGIPVIFHEECLHGLAAKDATSFPQPIGLGATFNPKLIEQIYTVIAEDTRTRGAHQALTPVVDVAREPRWGRVEETFGEDPYLVAQMGIAAVRGFQGDGTFKDKKRVIATLKHFAAHGQPESGTNCAPVNVSERLLRDTFLYTFREAIHKGNAYSVMASYNEIDGVPSHANAWLLRDVLRKEWGFKGYVVSDYYAITELHLRPEATSHCVAASKEEAAIKAVEAGVNIELPDKDCYPYLVQLVKEGKIKEQLIDELVEEMLRYKFLMGLFDDPYVRLEDVHTEVHLEQERSLALEAAHQTITLLKNEGNILPLKKQNIKNIAVIGPNANRVMLGGYSGTPRFTTTVYQEIVNKVGKDINVHYSEGCKITIGGSWNEDTVVFSTPEEDRKLIAEAVEVAKKAEIIVLAIGGNEQTSREAWSRVHMGDRAYLDLPGRQMELFEAMVATGKPIIVVLFHGRPNTIGAINEKAQAILECWYLGQEGGRAVADVLFGDYNPGGKLPISVPRTIGQIPIYYNYKPSARRGYLDEELTPLYPFGYGLSYTTFEFKNLRLQKNVIKVNEETTVTVDVTNTGLMTGDEVVQLYIRDCFSSVTRPVKELKGFQRIALKPGETKTVTFTISKEHLAFTTITMKWDVEPGDFEIMVGSSSRDEDLLKTTLTVQQ